MEALKNPINRIFRGGNGREMTLQTDASEKAWGATLREHNKEQAASAGTWTENQKKLHITHRECLATTMALQNMTSYLGGGG
jgi:hypothetical protein